MPPCHWYVRSLTRVALAFWAVTSLSFAQNTPALVGPSGPPKHFDHVLIVVLENQN
jgi:hypothetical protein